MYVHAPDSGVAMCYLERASRVQAGTRLFQFDVSTAESAVTAAKVSAKLVQNALDENRESSRIAELDPRSFSERRVAAAVTVEESYQTVLRATQSRQEVGLVDSLEVEQADLFSKSATLYLAREKVIATQLEHDREDTRQYLPKVMVCVNAMVRLAERNLGRLSVDAPTDGMVEPLFTGSQWVERGAAIAKYDRASEPQPRALVESEMTGYLKKIYASDDTYVKKGAVIGAFEGEALDLQDSHLSLQELLLERTQSRLAGETAFQLQSVVREAQQVADATLGYSTRLERRMEARRDVGLASDVDVAMARATRSVSEIELLRVASEQINVERLLKGLRRACEAQRVLIDLQRRSLSRQRNRLEIRAPVEGRLIWYATEGSFMSAGTCLAGIV
jgi:multidrug resistance efflux pump